MAVNENGSIKFSDIISEYRNKANHPTLSDSKLSTFQGWQDHDRDATLPSNNIKFSDLRGLPKPRAKNLADLQTPLIITNAIRTWSTGTSKLDIEFNTIADGEEYNEVDYYIQTTTANSQPSNTQGNWIFLNPNDSQVSGQTKEFNTTQDPDFKLYYWVKATNTANSQNYDINPTPYEYHSPPKSYFMGTIYPNITINDVDVQSDYISYARPTRTVEINPNWTWTPAEVYAWNGMTDPANGGTSSVVDKYKVFYSATPTSAADIGDTGTTISNWDGNSFKEVEITGTRTYTLGVTRQMNAHDEKGDEKTWYDNWRVTPIRHVSPGYRFWVEHPNGMNWSHIGNCQGVYTSLNLPNGTGGGGTLWYVQMSSEPPTLTTANFVADENVVFQPNISGATFYSSNSFTQPYNVWRYYFILRLTQDYNLYNGYRYHYYWQYSSWRSLIVYAC
jgi:hypothetical protein